MAIRLLKSIMMVGVLSLVGCTAPQGYKVAVSQCSSGQWRDKVNQEMLAAQHLYDHDVRLTIANSFDDAALQARQIDSLSQTDIDLLVVAPNEESADMAEALRRVHAKGIPVIFFDRKVAAVPYTAFIGGNNVEAGRIVGNYVVSEGAAMGRGKGPAGKPFVLEITGAMTTSPAQERHSGFAGALQGHDELEYVCREGDWTSDEACRIATEQIMTGHLPDIVFCHNDGMATGVYKAVVETGTEGRVKILGIDGMPGEGIEYVQFGHQVGTYVYPTHGEEIVRLAIDILTGRPYERDNRLRGMMVTAENADLVSMSSKELMKQNGDLITIQDKLEDYLGLYNTQRRVLWVLGVACLALGVGLLLMWRAFVQTRRTVRERQAMNEEQTLFYTNADSRTLSHVFDTPPEELPAPRSQDTIFAETLNAAIVKRMSDPNLKMDDLGDEVGLSRVQLYRKVKAITGLTPVELLRKMRLQQGYVLLATTTKTVQEIAYEVGFGTPGYFSKCFRQQYGKNPMDVRNSTNET